MKNFFSTLLSSFFKTLATAAGVILAVVVLIALLNRPATPGHTEGFSVAPNHQWETPPFSKTAPTILKIAIKGVIGQTITAEEVRSTLLDSLDSGLEKGQIKGILLSIDSPGGLASDSDAMYRLLQDYKTRYNTPIYVYTDGICASGGMMVACAADKIYASESTLIGSVGVLLPTTFNFTGLMEKLGVHSLTITSGKCKDELNPFRPWKADEAENIQYAADSYYQRFLYIVTNNRKGVTKEELIERGARIYPAPDAVNQKMIDGLAALESDVLLKLAQDLKVEENYQVIEFATKNWLKSLLQEQTLFNKEISVTAPGMLAKELQGKFLYLYHPKN